MLLCCNESVNIDIDSKSNNLQLSSSRWKHWYCCNFQSTNVQYQEYGIWYWTPFRVLLSKYSPINHRGQMPHQDIIATRIYISTEVPTQRHFVGKQRLHLILVMVKKEKSIERNNIAGDTSIVDSSHGTSWTKQPTLENVNHVSQYKVFFLEGL